MARLAGMAEVGIGPSLRGFPQKLRADLQKVRASLDVPVNPTTKRADAELAAWRKRQELNALNIPVNLDHKGFDRGIKRIEQTYSRSALSKAIRVQVYVAGASALPALAQGALSATTAITELGQSLLVLPGLLSGVAAAAGTLLTGLRGVGDAFKAASQGSKTAAQDARDYAKASRDLERAQRDVVTALKNANREIQDQKDKLTQGALGVEQAQINVQRANERLAKGGFDSMSDWRQAILDVKQANFDLSQAVKQSGRDVQDYYDNASKGATQTDTFKDAVDRLADATQSFTKAQQEAAGMTDKFIHAMQGLGPNAQLFVRQMLALKGAWRELQVAVSDSLFDGIGKSVTDLAQKRLPLLRAGMQEVAKGLNEDFKQILSTLGSDQNASAFTNIFKNTGDALKAATPGLNSFINGFVRLSEVGSRFLPRLATAFNKVMDRFDAFVQRADEDGSLERWIDKGLDLLASLGRSIISIGSILNSVTEAYEKATGNVGGFAATAERGLGKLAEYLKSPQGQNSLVNYIKDAKLFLGQIKESLPGIIDAFQAFGDAARMFATYIFPVFSGIGRFMQDHIGLVKAAIVAWYGFRTITPVIRTVQKVLGRLNAGVEAYRSRMVALGKAMETRDALEKRMGQLRLEREAMVLQAQKNSVKSAEDLEKNRKNILRSAVRAEEEAANKMNALRSDLAQVDKALASPQGPGVRAQYLEKQKRLTQELDAATRTWKSTIQEVDVAEGALLSSRKDAQRSFKQGNAEVIEINRAFRGEMDQTRQKIRNVDQAINNLSGGGGAFGRLRTAIGSRGGGGVIGAIGALGSAFGGLITAIGSIAVTGGLIYALDQVSAAHQRASAAADAQRDSEEALASTLEKGTGAATNATLEENLRQLRNRVNPVHADDRGQNFDAAAILNDQLGISPGEAAQLSLPTRFREREQRLQAADSRIIAAVPGLQEWQQWGEKYKLNGVDETVYGRALNGDPESIGKVEAARIAIKNSTTGGTLLNLGLATASGFAPNDLGAAQEQLDRSGPGGGLRGLSLASGALRAVGDSSIRAGARAQQDASAIPQKELNARGLRSFGAFNIAPNGVAILPDGSANISVDRDPGRAWADGARQNGITVTARPGGGANIHIDADSVPNYFQGFAAGGPVWGAGSATSDSIPAMLSNGEFVINAKAAQAIGRDRLEKMNALQHFWGGGSVLPWMPEPIKATPGGPLGVIASASGYTNPTAATISDGARAMQNIPGMSPLPGQKPTPSTIDQTGAIRIPGRPLEEASARQTAKDYIWQGVASIPRVLNGEQSNEALLNAGRALRDTFLPGLFGRDPERGFSVGPRGAPGWRTRLDSRSRTGNMLTPAGQADPMVPPYKFPVVEKPYVPPSVGSGSGTGKPPGPVTFPGSGNLPGPISPFQLPYTPGAGRSGAGQPIPKGAVPLVMSIPQGLTGPEGQPIPSNFPLGPRVPDSEAGLQIYTIQAKRIIENLFPEIQSIGGYREDPLHWHPDGLALDIMIPGAGGLNDPTPPEGLALGNRIWQWAIEHADELNLDIGASLWQQPDHYNHIHLVSKGGGFPDPNSLAAAANGWGSSGQPVTPPPGAAALPAGPAAGAPPVPAGPGIPGFGQPIPGPFGPIPFDGFGFLNSIGGIILQAIGSFFGIDLSGIFGFFQQIAGGFGGMGTANAAPPELPPDPGPDMAIYDQMMAEADAVEKAGDKATADSMRRAANDYKNRNTNQTIPQQPWFQKIPGQPGAKPPQQQTPTTALTPQSGADDVARRIYQEAINRGYSREQAAMILSTAMQESALGQAGSGGGGAWHGVFQQDTSYPGRDDPNQNITEFFNRLGAKGGPGSKDLWKTIFWLQQRPSEPNADSAFANGRQAYLNEIMGPMNRGDVQKLMDRLGFSGGGSADWDLWDFLDRNYGETIMQSGPTGMPYLLDAMHNAKGGFVPHFDGGGAVGNLADPTNIAALSTMGSMAATYFRAMTSKKFADWMGKGKQLGKARGGHVRGPGGPTEDRIPAMLSAGEFVMRAKAVDHYGLGTLSAMNSMSVPKAADGWLVDPLQPPPNPTGQTNGPMNMGNPPPTLQTASGTGSATAGGMGASAGVNPLPSSQAAQHVAQVGNSIASAAGTAISGVLGAKAGSSYSSPGASAPPGGQKQKDTRSVLGEAPTNLDHNLPALSQAVQGGIQTIGALAATAVQMGAGVAGAAAGAGPAGGMAGAAAAQGIQAASQIGGQAATGALNVLSSLLVGNITPGTTGQGYGAPLLPQQPERSGVRSFQSIHNGDVYTNNLDDWKRTQDRQEAQRALPFLNRV